MYKTIVFRKSNNDISYILIAGETPSKIWNIWKSICLQGEYDHSYSAHGANFPAFRTIFHLDALTKRGELRAEDLSGLSFSICETDYHVELVSEDLNKFVKEICEETSDKTIPGINNTALIADLAKDPAKELDWMKSHPATLIWHKTTQAESHA